ncbi:MAG: DsrE family protein [Gammaproteobacteria bacterium]|nr:DsrE family protein [Gammaproteobacteria bacterium]
MFRLNPLPSPTLLLIALILLFACTHAFADDFVQHKLVIQINSDDEKTQNSAMDNVVNLQKEVGMDNIEIEFVVYGAGLSMLIGETPTSQRVSSLALQNVTFSACGNTMHTIEARTGKPVELVEGVGVVKAGVLRIMELQEQGYAYLRP